MPRRLKWTKTLMNLLCRGSPLKRRKLGMALTLTLILTQKRLILDELY